MLSIEEFHGKEAQALYEPCLKKIDTHRLEKLHRLKVENAKELAIGAGMLLQLAWADCTDVETANVPNGNVKNEKVQDYKAQEHRKRIEESEIEIVVLRLSDLLQRLASDRFPVEIPYQYGEHGKPDFAEGGYHFNLSHSGDYVCLAVDQNQIGIDIQKMCPLRDLKVAEHFFTMREQEALKAYDEKQAQELLFYTIWVKKEAYAKLTGEGITIGVQKETLPEELMMEELSTGVLHTCGEIVWNMLQAPAGYRMAVCRFRDK